MSTSPSYDKYATITSSSSNVRSVSPMRVNALYKEPESDYCKRCAKYIYPLELMGPVMGHRYHKLCFRCHACERLLDFKNYRTNLIDLNDREIYCTAHNPRNGAFNDNIYGYNARSKSPGNVATTNDGVNEYSSSAEYYKVQQQHKSSENLDRTPYTPTYTVASNGNGGYVNLTNDYSTYEPQPLGYRTAYSKSSEKLLQESSVTSSTSHQHHRHEVSSSSMSSTTVGGSGVGIVPIPTATVNIPPIASVGTNTSFYLTNNSSGNNIQCLPSSNLGGLSNERYQYESNRYKTDSGSRNIVVDVITHDGDDDNDRIDSYDNYKYPTVDEHQYNQYNHNNQQYNTSDAITGTTSSYGGTYYDTNSKNYNLKSIISEAMSHDKSHQWQPEAPKRYHYPTSAGSSYDRTDSSGSSGSSHQNSNLKSIFAEASMAAAIRSSESRSSSVSTPSTPKDFPSNAGNLKNVYIDALNEHHRTSSGSASTTTYEGKDANLKQIYNEASHAAAQPNRGVLEDRTNNMKHIINEAAITNALAEKVAHNSTYSNDAYYPQQQPYVVSGGSPASITKTSTIEQHHHHQYSSSSTTVQHQTYHSSSSGNVTAVGPWTSSQSTNSPIISRPAINNQITIPVESDSDRKSNLVNIVNDVIATNNSAYSTYPNRFNFTGPNANLKGIVAEAIDYNSRNAPSNQNMYHNLKDSRPLEMDLSDMNQNNIIGENKGYGLARITVHYDQLRSRFSVTVHEARYLRNLDKKSVSDPYARVYLVPDGKPSYKRKTRIIKNNLNPVWQETFDYPISLNDALNKVLTVNLKDERGFFEKQEGQFLGEVVIPLRSVDNITSPFTRWYFLQPLNSTPNILATAGSNIKSF